jgi:hypothetical protein
VLGEDGETEGLTAYHLYHIPSPFERTFIAYQHSVEETKLIAQKHFQHHIRSGLELSGVAVPDLVWTDYDDGDRIIGEHPAAGGEYVIVSRDRDELATADLTLADVLSLQVRLMQVSLRDTPSKLIGVELLVNPLDGNSRGLLPMLTRFLGEEVIVRVSKRPKIGG